MLHTQTLSESVFPHSIFYISFCSSLPAGNQIKTISQDKHYKDIKIKITRVSRWTLQGYQYKQYKHIKIKITRISTLTLQGYQDKHYMDNMITLQGYPDK